MKKQLSTILCALSFTAYAQYVPPMQSQQRAEDVSAAALIEVELNGLGLDNVRWMGIAQYGHGPVQLVVEIPRSSKWMGSTCLKFKNMVRAGDAYTLNTGGYNIVYQNVSAQEGGDYGMRPDPERFSSFERVLQIAQEDSSWFLQARLKQNGQLHIKWVDKEGHERTAVKTVESMKPLQQQKHCGGVF